MIRKVKEKDLVNRILKAYEDNEDDEALEPVIVVDDEDKPIGRFEENDTVIFYDLRGEREIELTRALTEKNFKEIDAQVFSLVCNLVVSNPMVQQPNICLGISDHLLWPTICFGSHPFVYFFTICAPGLKCLGDSCWFHFGSDYCHSHLNLW